MRFGDVPRSTLTAAAFGVAAACFTIAAMLLSFVRSDTTTRVHSTRVPVMGYLNPDTGGWSWPDGNPEVWTKMLTACEFGVDFHFFDAEPASRVRCGDDDDGTYAFETVPGHWAVLSGDVEGWEALADVCRRRGVVDDRGAQCWTSRNLSADYIAADDGSTVSADPTRFASVNISAAPKVPPTGDNLVCVPGEGSVYECHWPGGSLTESRIVKALFLAAVVAAVANLVLSVLIGLSTRRRRPQRRRLSDPILASGWGYECRGSDGCDSGCLDRRRSWCGSGDPRTGGQPGETVRQQRRVLALFRLLKDKYRIQHLATTFKT